MTVKKKTTKKKTIKKKATKPQTNPPELREDKIIALTNDLINGTTEHGLTKLESYSGLAQFMIQLGSQLESIDIKSKDFSLKNLEYQYTTSPKAPIGVGVLLTGLRLQSAVTETINQS